MIKRLLVIWPIFFFLSINLLFFLPIFKGKIPFPGDTLIGAYFPWRDLKWEQRNTEYPLKNMTLSDATSSFYPWRFEAVRQMKAGKWPLWNRFEFSGNPLLANPSTAFFYPLNILFGVMNFNWAWMIQVVIQPVLAGLFLFLFLRNHGLSSLAAIFGSVCYSWGSYFLNVAEFNVPGNTALWLPLILLCVDKIMEKKTRWFGVLIFSLVMSLLAGFIQFVLYEFILTIAYAFFLVLKKPKRNREFKLIFLILFVSVFLCAFQVIPFLELVKESSRIEGYKNIEIITNFFVPWRQLLMFFAPDFFGNPGTANYWGANSYYEYCGYIGGPAMIFVFYLIFYRNKKKEHLFWLSVLVISLLLAAKNPFSLIPYYFRLPFLSSLVPARLLMVSTFSLSLLTSYGFEIFILNFKKHRRKQQLPEFKSLFVSLLVIFSAMWLIASSPSSFGILPSRQMIIARNLILPTILIGISLFCLILAILFPLRIKIIMFLIFLMLFFDLYRQGHKFLSFIDQKLIFPEIETTEFLREHLGYSRFLNTHQEIFGSNHQTVYALESIEGYNPLYKNDYGTFISLGQGFAPVNSFVVGFERTVFGRNFQSNVFNLLSVKYFLSFEDIQLPDYPLVFQEGRTKIYENTKALPRSFLVCNAETNSDSVEIMKKISLLDNLTEKVFINEGPNLNCLKEEKPGRVEITNYSSDQIELLVKATTEAILVTGDIYYPGWHVYVDGIKKKILKVDYTLRGVFLTPGEHHVRFSYEPESFKIGLVISSLTGILLIFSGVYLFIKNKWL